MLSNEDVKNMLRLSWLWRRAGAGWTSIGEVQEAIELPRREAIALMDLGHDVGAFDTTAGRFYRTRGGRAGNTARDRAINAMLQVGPTPRTCFYDHYQHPIDTRLVHRTQSGTIAAHAVGKYTYYTMPGQDVQPLQLVTTHTDERTDIVFVKVKGQPILELVPAEIGRGSYALLRSWGPWTKADHFIGQVKTLQNWVYAARTAAVCHGVI